ncbi:hypothetical protein AVEN_159174-1 [Araneus ventricosus]|uniref:Uncharacterized protein n=1 Tax=Araneus ventricosus TaxID=182803 RepID=A0A4Y2IR74_ARAVE|nr:hypothetical protein AVEN_109776-1 [Araneus ventricosus]GBM80185.1 hypothetical protein AVEN_159174-1 [Araneus ventricosus]
MCFIFRFEWMDKNSIGTNGVQMNVQLYTFNGRGQARHPASVLLREIALYVQLSSCMHALHNRQNLASCFAAYVHENGIAQKRNELS